MTAHLHQSPPLAVAAWGFQVVGPIIWVVMAVHFYRQCRRLGTLTLPALVFLGATTQFWLEWYADWGGYVLYNHHLALIHGWDTPLASPNKPWAVIPAYGWFFGAIYLPLIALLKRVHGALGRRLRLPRFSVFLHRFTGRKYHAARIVTWILTMNLTYGLCFTVPIILIRALFLPHDPRV